jgi:hypothetical protein
MIDELCQTHGYASDGESFSISDGKTIWLMELIGKGATKGAVWVASRVPEGYVGSTANQARTRTFAQNDPANVLYSEDVVTFAQSVGLYPKDGAPEDFSFSDVYDPVSFTGARLAEARVWNLFNALSDGAFMPYLDYAQGRNLTNRMPLFAKAAHPLAVNDTMHLMRTHFEGTWFDTTGTLRADVGAGSGHSAYRFCFFLLFKRLFCLFISFLAHFVRSIVCSSILLWPSVCSRCVPLASARLGGARGSGGRAGGAALRERAHDRRAADRVELRRDVPVRCSLNFLLFASSFFSLCIPFSFFSLCSPLCLSPWMPAPLRALMWWAPDDSSTAVRIPVWGGATSVPLSFADPVGQEPGAAVRGAVKADAYAMSLDSAFWVWNLVANTACVAAPPLAPNSRLHRWTPSHACVLFLTSPLPPPPRPPSRYGERYNVTYPLILAEILAHQDKLFSAVDAKEKVVAALYATDPVAALKMATEFVVATGDAMTAEWRGVWMKLFARFRDGFTITAPVKKQCDVATNERENCTSRAIPIATQQGYTDDWYSRIVADGSVSFLLYTVILRESCSQFDSLP